MKIIQHLTTNTHTEKKKKKQKKQKKTSDTIPGTSPQNYHNHDNNDDQKKISSNIVLQTRILNSTMRHRKSILLSDITIELPGDSSSISNNNHHKTDQVEVVTATKQQQDPTTTTTKYKVVGIGPHGVSKWDPQNGHAMEKLLRRNLNDTHDDDREIYAFTFETVLPVESVIIIDANLGYKRRFYPQGDCSRRFTRALEGNEELGHNIYWTLVGVEAKTQVTVYFAPLEGTFAWTLGPLEHNYDMPLPEPGLRAEDVWALTQFEIEKDDYLSNILLMAADPVAMWAMSSFIMIPHFILAFIAFWFNESAPKQMNVNLYKTDTLWEWMTFVVLYVSIFIKNMFDTGERFSAAYGVLSLAGKVRNNTNKDLSRGLYVASLFAFVNILQGPLAFVMSIFVALYLSEDIFLNVLLNIATMEFITEVDDAMISAWIRWRYSNTAKVSFSILDLTYSKNINEAIDIWHNSNSSKDRVLDNLCRGEISNETRWDLLTSRKDGLGILDSLEDGRQCVSSILLHLDVLDWERQPREKIANLGGLYLAGTSNESWEHQLDKRTHALLFQHFPELTVKFPWFGVMNLDHHKLTVEHAPFISEIVNTNPEVNVISCNFSTIGDEGLETLCENLVFDDETLHTLGFCACGLTDSSMLSVANVLRREDVSLKYIWLLCNKGIGDTGAIQLAAALSEGIDANKTLDVIWMGLNNVSLACQKECSRKTNGRMVFIQDDQLIDWERKGWDKAAMVSEKSKPEERIFA